MRAGEHFGAIGVEIFGFEMRVGINDSQRSFSVFGGFDRLFWYRDEAASKSGGSETRPYRIISAASFHLRTDRNILGEGAEDGLAVRAG